MCLVISFAVVCVLVWLVALGWMLDWLCVCACVRAGVVEWLFDWPATIVKQNCLNCVYASLVGWLVECVVGWLYEWLIACLDEWLLDWPAPQCQTQLPKSCVCKID